MSKGKKSNMKKKSFFKGYYVAAVLYILISLVLTITQPSAYALWIGFIFAWMIGNGVFLIYLIWKKSDITHTLIPALFLFDFLISSNLAYVISQYNLTALTSPWYTASLFIIPAIILIISVKRILK
jgi:hypothetical protein